MGNFGAISIGYADIRKGVENGDWPAVGKALGQVLYTILNVRPPRNLLLLAKENSQERVL